MAGKFGDLPIHIGNSTAPTSPASGVDLYSSSSVLNVQNSTGSFTVQPRLTWFLEGAPTISSTSINPAGTLVSNVYWTMPADLKAILNDGYTQIGGNAVLQLDFSMTWIPTNNTSPMHVYLGATQGGGLNIGTTDFTAVSSGSNPVQTNRALAFLSSIQNPLITTGIGISFSLDNGVGTATWNLVGYQEYLVINLYPLQT